MHKIITKHLKKSRAYKKIFLNEKGLLTEEGKIILDDLLNFSKFFTDLTPNSEVLNMLEGRRQVLRRVWKNINLKEKDLLNFVGDRDDS